MTFDRVMAAVWVVFAIVVLALGAEDGSVDLAAVIGCLIMAMLFAGHDGRR